MQLNITPISLEDSYVHDPCTSTASCFQENILIGSEEKRQEILAKKISPMTSGKGVPSPFKRNLLWPKSPKKTTVTRRRLRMPAVVTSGQYDKYEEEKEAKKQEIEMLKFERKRKREEKKNSSNKKVSKKKELAQDEDEDWTCSECRSRYNSEVIRGLMREWVECDGCTKQFHIDCLPSNHKKEFGLNNINGRNVEFLCHYCVTEDNNCSSDDEFNENSNDEED